MEFDKTTPIDCATHPYRGSTTNEKVKVVSEYEDRKIEMLILQDGKHNVPKHHQKVWKTTLGIMPNSLKNVLNSSNQKYLLYVKFL